MKDLLLKENGDLRADLIASMAINTANAATAALEKANRLIELMISNIDRYDHELYKAERTANTRRNRAESDGGER